MPAPSVILFVSAGRCGTQWLAAALGTLYPELEVAHEPVGPMYAPRRHFRGYDGPEAPLQAEAVRRHVERLEALERPYVETGWPLFGALPLLRSRLGERLRLVHLTRHPVPSALSHATHSSYAGSGRDDAYTRLATLGPSDPRVFQAGYAERWEALSAFERCLFWWTEVHLFALELAARWAEVPMLRIAAEAMLAGEEPALRSLTEFIGVPWDPRLLARTMRPVDRWHHHTDAGLDPAEIERHPLAVAVAGALDYRLADADPAALSARYRGMPEAGADRFARRW